MFSAHELIVAPATAAGPGARAIVRLAGDGLDGLLARLFAAAAPGFAVAGAAPRVVAARLADDGLGREWGAVPVEVLHWPGPSGPIGGPLAEVQLPCSAPLVEAVVAEACRHGARLARGGEFTLRAFLTGRLDLVQAEAVLAVVDARTPAELAAALDRMAGGSGVALRRCRDTLLDLLADVEAAIDFADETTPDAVPVADAASRRRLTGRLEAEAAALAAVERQLGTRGSRAGDQPRVVLVGPPNIGKSSLFNALVGAAAAVVADEPGTTRDWIERPLGGGPGCLLVDLAGIEDGEPGDAVAAAAAAVAREQISRADVVVSCRDAVADTAIAVALPAVPRIDVLTRCDRVAGPGAAGSGIIATSVVTGRGIDSVRGAIEAAVAGLPPRDTPATLRLAVGVAAARAALDDAVLGSRGTAVDEALLASHVRRAVDALGEVTGTAIGTDLIDRIFSRHCIGK